MDSREFTNTLPIILKELEGTRYDKELVKLCNSFRTYMYTHSDEDIVINAKREILSKYKRLFTQETLLIALDMADDLRYFKKQRVFAYLPFIHSHRNYYHLLYQLFIVPSQYFGTISNSYAACKYIFEENKNIITSPNLKILDKINKFVEQNKIIMDSTPDPYDDIDTEFKRYTMSDSDLRNDPDYQAYLFVNMLYDNDESLQKYRNKKLGTCGEYYIWNSIKNRINASFVSKNLGNGFGYDLYYQDTKNGKVIEKLIEVKTTSSYDNDFFVLSENEYNVLLNSLDKDNVEYLLSRVYYNENKYRISHEALRFEKNLNVFVSIYDNQPKYILTGHRRFDRINPVKKREL